MITLNGDEQARLDHLAELYYRWGTGERRATDAQLEKVEHLANLAVRNAEDRERVRQECQ